MPSLIGTKVNQVPTVGDLGTLAFQDSNAVNLTGGTAVIDNLTADAINLKVDTDISNIAPSLNLDFANSKTLDPRITYTRASTATYYDGVTTAKAEENLTTFSQDFSNVAWIKSAINLTANSSVAPDGTTTATTVAANGTNAYHWIGAPNGTILIGRTFSVFAKAGTNNFIQLLMGGDTSVYANFDISSGTVGNTGGTGTVASMVSFGSGWYRCIIYTPSATATNFYTALVTSNTAVRAEANTLSTDVYLWGAQLEQRSAVSSYTPTTTQAITNYIPALQTAASGVARFEHNPTTGESLGLLIEEARTNLVTYSEQFDDASWGKVLSSVTVSPNTVVAPDGTLTGDKLIEATTTGTHIIAKGTTYVAGTTYTVSVYAKAAERSYLTIDIASLVLGGFNLSTGVATIGVGNSNNTLISATMTSVGNGWYRCTGTWTRLNTNLTSTNGISISTATSGYVTASYTGDGFSGIYIWGAQLEAGAFATSYIPTVASQVTRAADAASMTGTNFSSWYNQQEGTLYADVVPTASLNNRVSLDFNAGSTSSNYMALFAQRSSSTGILAYVNANAVSQVDASTQGNADGKTVFAYKTNDFAMTRNGASAFADTSGLVPQGIDRVFIGDDYNAGNSINGTIKKIQYFPKRLPNAELVEMTS